MRLRGELLLLYTKVAIVDGGQQPTSSVLNFHLLEMSANGPKTEEGNHVFSYTSSNDPSLPGMYHTFPLPTKEFDFHGTIIVILDSGRPMSPSIKVTVADWSTQTILKEFNLPNCRFFPSIQIFSFSGELFLSIREVYREELKYTIIF